MADPRTFQITAPHMRGRDIEAWQRTLLSQFKRWGVVYPLQVDGDYGVATRSATATVLFGLGIRPAAMVDGVTPELRIRVRNRKLGIGERARYVKRAGWRRQLRGRLGPRVAAPLQTVIADSWGWYPGVHDGIDLICDPNATLYAMCDGEIVRADTGGWWGKAPSGDVSKGDGIVIVRCATNTGPFRKGLNICYGHAETPLVQVGQRVRAGQPIARAGLAVAYHTHLMVNARSDTRGVGDRDPRPFYEFAVKHDRKRNPDA